MSSLQVSIPHRARRTSCGGLFCFVVALCRFAPDRVSRMHFCMLQGRAVPRYSCTKRHLLHVLRNPAPDRASCMSFGACGEHATSRYSCTKQHLLHVLRDPAPNRASCMNSRIRRGTQRRDTHARRGICCTSPHGMHWIALRACVLAYQGAQCCNAHARSSICDIGSRGCRGIF